MIIITNLNLQVSLSKCIVGLLLTCGFCHAQLQPAAPNNLALSADYITFQMQGCTGDFYSADWQLYCHNATANWQQSLAVIQQNHHLQQIYNSLLNNGTAKQTNIQVTEGHSKQTLYNLGLSLAHNLEFKLAITMFQRLVATYPDFQAAAHNLRVLTAKTPPATTQTLQLRKQSAKNQPDYWHKLIKVLDNERANTDLRMQTVHHATADQSQ